MIKISAFLRQLSAIGVCWQPRNVGFYENVFIFTLAYNDLDRPDFLFRPEYKIKITSSSFRFLNPNIIEFSEEFADDNRAFAVHFNHLCVFQKIPPLYADSLCRTEAILL